MADPAYSAFFLGTHAAVIQYELLEITHPSFSKTYRIVRNAANGLTVTLETNESAVFDYYPLRITRASVDDNLDQSFKIDLGDLGEVLPLELDRVFTQDGFGTKPTVIYRSYRSDVLTAPLVGPLLLEVDSFSFTKQGASFDAKAPTININKTGELYTLDRFPALRGYL